MRVRFETNSPYGITKYLRTLRMYGEVTTTLKRGHVDPIVEVEFNGNVLSKLYEIMDETGATLVLSENNGADADVVPLIVEIEDKQAE
ncbi:hypothetical protein [Paenibacillus alkalitolerans]|uniref:hypothetical protein n=1 Tax=Paenibacillus alkalitolerans TaxID=2799335 RepID=UPI0018F40652|nr:hypothetical protein [Paenibacillus alkalitolerans]